MNYMVELRPIKRGPPRVEYGQGDEHEVEGVPHVLACQDEADDEVAEEAAEGQRRLRDALLEKVWCFLMCGTFLDEKLDNILVAKIEKNIGKILGIFA
jgi:hypothetical protein